MMGRAGFTAAAAVSLWVGYVTPAAAQVEIPPAHAATEVDASPRLRRVVGFGTTIGGGGGVALGGGLVGAGPMLLLPTLETLIYIDESTSIDISVPVGNLVFASVFTNATFVTATAYLDFSLPLSSEEVRLIGGPGLGFAVVTARSRTVGALRFAGLVGAEFVTFDRLFAFRLMTRPFLELWFSDSSAGVGGGAMLEFGFDFFVTSD